MPSGSVSLNAQIGAAFGQQNFNEEFWGPGEAAIEVQPGFALPVAGVPGLTRSHIDLTTNDQINIGNFGSRDFVGFTGQAAGSYYAVRIPASQISAINPGGDIYIQEALYDTFHFDASVPPTFAEAALVTGTVSGSTATLDLAHPLARVTGFVGQDNDFAPFYFPLPSAGQAGAAGDRARRHPEPLHRPAAADDHAVPGRLGAAAADRARRRQRHQRRADQRLLLSLHQWDDVDPGHQLQLPLRAGGHRAVTRP